ncbi:MAG: WYL domain-containing protein [Bacilli bacterium]|nr:WYL domain-containing protein [Bacilli bacterium]
MSKVSNVLKMIEILSTGRKYSIEELSNELEVSKRMIRVYKDELEKAGIYLHTIKGPYGGYVLNQELNIPKRFIPTTKIILNDKSVFNSLSRAIKERKKCLIEYYSKEKGLTKRIIRPYEMTLLNNEWGVAAYCEVREEIRHFYLNRIKTIEILEEFY